MKRKMVTHIAREDFLEEETCMIIMSISIVNIYWVMSCARFYSGL